MTLEVLKQINSLEISEETKKLLIFQSEKIIDIYINILKKYGPAIAYKVLGTLIEKQLDEEKLIVISNIVYAVTGPQSDRDNGQYIIQLLENIPDNSDNYFMILQNFESYGLHAEMTFHTPYEKMFYELFHYINRATEKANSIELEYIINLRKEFDGLNDINKKIQTIQTIEEKKHFLYNHIPSYIKKIQRYLTIKKIVEETIPNTNELDRFQIIKYIIPKFSLTNKEQIAEIAKELIDYINTGLMVIFSNENIWELSKKLRENIINICKKLDKTSISKIIEEISYVIKEFGEDNVDMKIIDEMLTDYLNSVDDYMTIGYLINKGISLKTIEKKLENSNIQTFELNTLLSRTNNKK